MPKGEKGERKESGAVHLLLAACALESFTEFRGPFPDFGYQKPSVIFCYPNLWETAMSLRKLLDEEERHTSVRIFASVDGFPILSFYDYVVMVDKAEDLWRIGRTICQNVLGDTPRHKQVRKTMGLIMKFGGGNLVSIHFPLVPSNRGVEVAVGNIPNDLIPHENRL